MTRTRHTEEHIIAVLKDAQAGIGVPELSEARHLGCDPFISGGPSMQDWKSAT